MRENMGLFRGKHPNGMWVYGSLAVFRNIKNEPYTAIIPVEDGENQIRRLTRVDPDTVGECTGLKDKDGKLLFEGDIFDWGYAGVKDKRYVVVYDTKMASFIGERGFGFVTLNGIDIEIIGNIYDNPKLMKGAGENADN